MKKASFLLIFVLLSIPKILYSQQECEITYIANEGFLIEAGEKKVLIDALFDRIDEDWCDSPSDSVVNLMKEARPPFNEIDLIAVTHSHRDHFDAFVLAAHLMSNPGSRVICPRQVEELLSEHLDYNTFKNRVISFTPPLLGESKVVISDIPIRMLRLEHSPYMENDPVSGERVNRHRNVENLGYAMEIGGINFFHCGDTNPVNEEEYATFALNEADIDVAFLERMFFTVGEEGARIIDTHINPTEMVLMHIRPGNQGMFASHFENVDNVHVFQEKMTRIIVSFEK